MAVSRTVPELKIKFSALVEVAMSTTGYAYAIRVSTSTLLANDKYD
ncbi:hypothetical protein [Nostoc sp. LPT]|nr:hypothetical protein [Nostoc sp. LPT]MBN4005521.1 hypothetical protein [Nostoc sp. LPT]